jgi:CRISPR system Cascade subunit CasB
MTDVELPLAPAGLDGLVARMSALMLHAGGALSTGDVAALRRMDPRRLDAAFFKLAGLALESELSSQPSKREDRESRWAAVVVGLAHLGDLHDPRARLGKALVTADLSELRFARLLQADGDRLIDELPSVARFLSAKGVAANWADAARLVLSAGRRDEEAVRRNLARDYYFALARKQD